MAQADTTPTPFSIRHQFEELPIFWQFTDQVAWRGGLIDGEFEVSFDHSGDWWISDLWIACDNGKRGADAKGKLINLDADERSLYLLVLDSVDQKYATWIDERVADELAVASTPTLRLVA